MIYFLLLSQPIATNLVVSKNTTALPHGSGGRKCDTSVIQVLQGLEDVLLETLGEN